MAVWEEEWVADKAVEWVWVEEWVIWDDMDGGMGGSMLGRQGGMGGRQGGMGGGKER